jgi:hypothetical protein
MSALLGRHPNGLTDRDERVLMYAGEHKCVLPAQIAVLLEAPSLQSAYRRLLALRQAGLLRQDQLFDRQPSCFQITASGLGAIESGLGNPKDVDRAHYRHDVGVGWLWLAARRGVWGDVGSLVSEREMRSKDRTLDAASADAVGGPFGVRLGGTGPRGQPRLHYPDLLLIDGAGQRIALELELSAKQPRRLEEILSAYAIDARIQAVLYVVDRADLTSRIRTAARRHGVSDLVRVQRLEWGAAAPSRGGRTAQRTAARRRSPAASTARSSGRSGAER